MSVKLRVHAIEKEAAFIPNCYDDNNNCRYLTMDVALQNVTNVQPPSLAILHDRLIVSIGRTSRRGVVIKDRIEDDSLFRRRAGNDVGHCGRALVEEAVY